MVAVTQAVTDAVIELATEQDTVLNTITEESDDFNEESSTVEVERKFLLNRVQTLCYLICLY